jgi:hypothetical protein
LMRPPDNKTVRFIVTSVDKVCKKINFTLNGVRVIISFFFQMRQSYFGIIFNSLGFRSMILTQRFYINKITIEILTDTLSCNKYIQVRYLKNAICIPIKKNQ